MTISGSGFYGSMGELFSPQPKKKEQKVEAYLATTAGSQAVFELVARVAELSKTVLSKAEWVCCFGKVQEVFDVSAQALDLPDVVSAPRKLMGSCSSLFSPESGDTSSLARRIKEVVYDSLGLARSGAKSVLFVASTGCASFSLRKLFQANMVSAATTLLMDSVDLVRDCLVLKVAKDPVKEILPALANVIKNVASVVASVFIWLALFIPQIAAAPWFSPLLLATGLIFSLAKISAYFLQETEGLTLPSPA